MTRLNRTHINTGRGRVQLILGEGWIGDLGRGWRGHFLHPDAAVGQAVAPLQLAALLQDLGGVDVDGEG